MSEEKINQKINHKINLAGIIRFSEFLNLFEKVDRIVHAADGVRMENDVEHSYKLSMLADYIIATAGLNLDRSKVMMYCLVHDIVEAYAGDTYIFTKDTAHLESKHAREHAALLRIKEEFPEYPEMTDCIEKYEARADEESKFVYVLDKIHPALQIYLGGGKTWRQEGMTFNDLMGLKNEKVKLYPDLETLWHEFVALLETNKTELFPS